ncbi:MAG: polymer-forming cytoskeletal protein [Phycisphaerales bacterium JB038]
MVTCYLCGHDFEVSPRAITVSCPSCARQLMAQDVTVKGHTAVTNLPSCGKVVVKPRGRVVAKKIIGQEGVTCEGSIEGEIETTATVRLERRSKCQGAIRAGRLIIAEGASLEGEICVPWRPDAPPTLNGAENGRRPQ